MRNRLFLLASYFIIASLGTFAQSTTSPKKIIIINGKFFQSLPEGIGKMMTPNGMEIYMISTPNGTKATGINMPQPLPNEVLQDTIPITIVPEGTELLRRFEEALTKANENKKLPKQKKLLFKEGTEFPHFTSIDINGKSWSNADVKNKIMVLNLWFTGCGPCRAEMPELSTWKEEMPEVMFFSSTYESPEIVRHVIESRKFNWIPLVNDTLFTKYVDNKGYPITIIIDKRGTIAMVEYGTSSAQRAALKQKIQSLLKQ